VSYTADLHAVVEAAGLERFALAGMSLGFPICVSYCAAYPERVTHLISLNGFARQLRSEEYPGGMPKDVLEGVLGGWKNRPEETLRTFIDVACTEKHSLRDTELMLKWAHGRFGSSSKARRNASSAPAQSHSL